jgi:DNA-binding transcriptional LysR family regulator
MEALNLLESFIQSAETGSFSAAARRLGLTPAAISKNVARLENHLGLRLFQRSTRRLTLTMGGEQFLQQVSDPFSTLRDAFASAAQEDGKPAGVLRVAWAWRSAASTWCRCLANSWRVIRASCRTGISRTAPSI